MKTYADTSVIAAWYLRQANSTAAIAFANRSGDPLPFTPWHRVEVRNAVRLAVFRKFIDLPQSKMQLTQLDEDLRDQVVLMHAPLDWVEVGREAEKIGAAHTPNVGCRAGDLFHVASAVSLGCAQFLTFDEQQKKLAKAAGLSVVV